MSVGRSRRRDEETRNKRALQDEYPEAGVASLSGHGTRKQVKEQKRKHSARGIPE